MTIKVVVRSGQRAGRAATCGVRALRRRALVRVSPGMSARAGDVTRNTPHPRVVILTDRCAGCQECVIRCPTGALNIDTARWVVLADDTLCSGCRQCERTCPFSAIDVKGPMVLESRNESEVHHPRALLGDVSEIRLGFAGWPAALAEAQRCLQCPDPTCVRGCPAHNDIPGFIGALAQRDLTAARDILARTSLLADICSRVCNQAAQCEGACSWSLAGGAAVAIGALERFVVDHSDAVPPTKGEANGLSVGIVGSGPAGVAAAWDLFEAGVLVTVYEKEIVPGGLSSWAIPDFALPRAVATRAWRQLVAAGLDLRCSSEIKPEHLDELLATHDAVIVANGAPNALRAQVPGADLAGIIDATNFLHGAKMALEDGGSREDYLAALGCRDVIGKSGPVHVLVLGAGNTAMDVARSALRLGATATCVDWLDERRALARPDELSEARDEGVDVRFLCTLTGLRGEDGRVVGAQLARTTQDRANTRPTVVPASVFELSVDLVVMAIGYRCDPAFADVLPSTPLRVPATLVADRQWSASGVLAKRARHDGSVDVGASALAREDALWVAALPVRERLWVVGDALTGPASVVQAMAEGRRAASAILDVHPIRPGHCAVASSLAPSRVLVCYESSGDRSAAAAHAIVEGYRQRKIIARSVPINRVGAAQLALSDMVVVGSSVKSFASGTVRQSDAMKTWLATLPRLAGKPFGIYCAFASSPRSTLHAMRRELESKGAIVIAQAAFGRQELGARAGVFGPEAFVEDLTTGFRQYRDAARQAVSSLKQGG